MRALPLATALLALVAAAFPHTLAGQQGFLFGPPGGSFSLRFGGAVPMLGGDAFEEFQDLLTLERKDFAAEAVTADFYFGGRSHVDIGLSVGYSKGRAESEFRDFTYQDDSPIEQTTSLRRIPLMAGLRYYPLARGRSLGQYAWVPSRFAPFVGVGAGWTWYKLEQEGEFVDKNSYAIFPGAFETSGSAFATHAQAGADYWVSSRIAVTGEGRYTWASASPGSDFDFDSIDLSGFQMTAGISFRF